MLQAADFLDRGPVRIRTRILLAIPPVCSLNRLRSPSLTTEHMYGTPLAEVSRQMVYCRQCRKVEDCEHFVYPIQAPRRQVFDEKVETLAYSEKKRNPGDHAEERTVLAIVRRWTWVVRGVAGFNDLRLSEIDRTPIPISAGQDRNEGDLRSTVRDVLEMRSLDAREAQGRQQFREVRESAVDLSFMRRQPVEKVRAGSRAREQDMIPVHADLVRMLEIALFSSPHSWAGHHFVICNPMPSRNMTCSS
jgi:hypothetical protein